MPKSVVISEHARRRAAERLEMSRRADIVHQFRQALMYGLSPTSFRGPFSQYLKSKLTKNRYCTVKVYCDFTYIHRNKKLITMFPVPDKYLPVKQYLPSNMTNIVEKENDVNLQLRRYYKSSEFKFYIKEPGKNNNTYLVALVVKEQLAAVSRGKDLEKQKIACVKQHINELLMNSSNKEVEDGNTQETQV